MMNKRRILNISLDTYNSLSLFKEDGESFDSLLRRTFELAPLERAPRDPLKPRAPKYPIRSLGVGESVLVPYVWKGGNNMNYDAIRAAVAYEAKRSGKQFKTDGSREGLKVTRIK